MELIPIIDGVSEALFGGSPAEAEKQDAAHLPPAVEVLEDRVLLASDASVPLATPAGMPAEPTAYVAGQNPGHNVVDLAGVAEAVDASPESGQATHDSSSSGQMPTHASESHAEIVEHPSEQPETRLSEAGELIEHDVNRNEFGLATIEPEPSKVPQDRELAKELVGDNQKVSPMPDPSRTEPAIGEVDADTPAVSVAVEVAVKSVAEELSTGIVQDKPIPAAVVLDPSGSTSPKQPVINNALPEAQADVLLQSVLQGESSDVAATTPEVRTAGDKPGKTDGADVNSAPVIADAIDSLPAAHDALFANGSGAEAVLERPSA